MRLPCTPVVMLGICMNMAKVPVELISISFPSASMDSLSVWKSANIAGGVQSKWKKDDGSLKLYVPLTVL